MCRPRTAGPGRETPATPRVKGPAGPRRTAQCGCETKDPVVRERESRVRPAGRKRQPCLELPEPRRQRWVGRFDAHRHSALALPPPEHSSGRDAGALCRSAKDRFSLVACRTVEADAFRHRSRERAVVVEQDLLQQRAAAGRVEDLLERLHGLPVRPARRVIVDSHGGVVRRVAIEPAKVAVCVRSIGVRVAVNRAGMRRHPRKGVRHRRASRRRIDRAPGLSAHPFPGPSGVVAERDPGREQEPPDGVWADPGIGREPRDRCAALVGRD